jgi:hypothetical protein
MNYGKKKEEDSKPVVTTIATSQSYGRDVAPTLLGTAYVFMKDKAGTLVKVRAMLDQGSQSTVITEECAKRLGLKVQHSNAEVHGIDVKQGITVTGKVKVHIQNKIGDFTHNGDVLVIKGLSRTLPNQEIVGDLEIDRNLNLADTNYKKPGPIDAIIGVDLYMKACRRGLRHPKNGGPGAQNTAFGWVIMGAIPKAKLAKTHSDQVVVSLATLKNKHPSSRQANRSYLTGRVKTDGSGYQPPRKAIRYGADSNWRLPQNGRFDAFKGNYWKRRSIKQKDDSSSSMY